MDTSLTILSHLLFNETYARKVLPYVKPEYFQTQAYNITYNLLTEFVTKYNTFPSKEALLIELKGVEGKGINETVFRDTRDLILDIKPEEETNITWLVDKTEEWCKNQALENALTKAIEITKGGPKGNLAKGAIPQLMMDALAVSFDNRIGHDFLEDAEERYDFYNSTEKRIPFSLRLMNAITGGGASTKSLICFMAPTGGGKSRLMCGEAAFQLEQGYNVLYISMEMAEKKLAKRIDANLLDIPIGELKTFPKAMYIEKIKRLRTRTAGRLVLKEYPTASAGANHFRFLLNELKIKKNFVPDIIYIDYLNICISSRMKMGPNISSYGFIKAIAEELRGLGVENDVPIITATQINREGMRNSDLEMEHISESIGLPATCDLLLAVTSNKDIPDQIQFKQLKNRDGDPTYYPKFMVGLDSAKMRLYDLDDPIGGISQDINTPIMDQTTFGQRDKDIFKDFT